MEPATDTTTATTICANYDFSDLVSLRVFVDGIMKNQETEVATTVGLTTAQMTAFNDPANPTSFGGVLASVLAAEAVAWSCASATECTATELATSQWGASTFTRTAMFSSPVTSGNGFIDNTAYSMCDWGSYTYPGCSFPPEYGAYQNQPYSYLQKYLSNEQVSKFMATDYSWYGMSNIYNGMMLFQDYEIVKKDWVQPSAYWSDAAAFYGMDSAELQQVVLYLEWQATEWLTEGITSQKNLKDLIMGYDTNFVDKINTGSLLVGNIYVDTEITPFLNLWKGPTSGRRIEMFKGMQDDGTYWPEDAGSIR